MENTNFTKKVDRAEKNYDAHIQRVREIYPELLKRAKEERYRDIFPDDVMADMQTYRGTFVFLIAIHCMEPDRLLEKFDVFAEWFRRKNPWEPIQRTYLAPLLYCSSEIYSREPGRDQIRDYLREDCPDEEIPYQIKGWSVNN